MRARRGGIVVATRYGEVSLALTTRSDRMEFLERIESQIAATGLPLVGITVAAVPCPDTPVILTLHWHGFIRDKAGDAQPESIASYIPVPSSALQLNDRWDNLVAVDRAAMEAGWALGAWDVARAERRGCL